MKHLLLKCQIEWERNVHHCSIIVNVHTRACERSRARTHSGYHGERVVFPSVSVLRELKKGCSVRHAHTPYTHLRGKKGAYLTWCLLWFIFLANTRHNAYNNDGSPRRNTVKELFTLLGTKPFFSGLLFFFALNPGKSFTMTCVMAARTYGDVAVT